MAAVLVGSFGELHSSGIITNVQVTDPDSEPFAGERSSDWLDGCSVLSFCCKTNPSALSELIKALNPLEHFKTLNEFFIRELKSGSRPISSPECDDIAVCAADCRLMAFNTVDDSSRFWIKVAVVAIGATMVGSINFTKKKGDHVKKGDERCKHFEIDGDKKGKRSSLF
ncbi:phosphatidylserine decarboxylase [Stylosanthes scabra]|uniref:Phosphatidylserine decarboxylase n=1 Tax=Stylosanthes scabra TaxID=79078 RepID=A0ABU6QAG3_9FABA|nr:phosphatidylserine decarboxylase [Stylosanthes scabra]